MRAGVALRLLLTLVAATRFAEGAINGSATVVLSDNLHIASFRGNEEIAQAMLDAKWEVDKRDEEGWTPLFLAASRGHVNMTKKLLDAEADPSAKGADGKSPLHASSFEGHEQCTRLLLDAGADVSAR